MLCVVVYKVSAAGFPFPLSCKRLVVVRLKKLSERQTGNLEAQALWELCLFSSDSDRDFRNRSFSGHVVGVGYVYILP